MKRKTAGRPLKGKAPRNMGIRIRVTAQEYQAIDKAAKAKGVSMTDVLTEPFRKG